MPGRKPQPQKTNLDNQTAADQPLKKYIYRGDRWTDIKYKGQTSIAVLNPNGKCIRGRNGNMLVSFSGLKVVVSARHLRKLKP
jgi:hypothetical protein